MPNDFQKTVNLKEKPRSNRIEEIDNVYGGKENEFYKINRPEVKQINESFVKRVVIFLVIIFIFFVVYFLFFRKGDNQVDLKNNSGWYAVKLVDGETFYGQIDDMKSDPIVIRNVYYNYDQQKGENKTPAENTTLRLVKRGQETHGPDGTMNIIRSQVLITEPLKKGSKVLEAILNYEN